jgi:plasmid stabilization system protein ParE
MNIEFSARAEADIEAIAKWWSRNRDVGPGPFFAELEEAEKQLLNNPEQGAPWRRRDGELVRRWLMEGTQYHLYYVFRPEDNQLWVLTVWGTKRLEPEL